MAREWTYKRNWNYEVSYRDLVGDQEKTMNLKVPYDSDAIRCVASEIAGIDFDYGEYADVMANYLQIVNGDNGNHIHYIRNTDKNYYVFMDEPSIRKRVKNIMARVWAGKSDVDEAVDTIARCIEETGVIPEALIRAYWTSIDRSTHGLVQRFYEQLTAKCPQALEYFIRRPVELDIEEEV